MRKLENKELERKSVTAFKEATKTPIIIILDDIRSLHNIGSVFRTADAFLIEKIYLCGITAIPPNKEIHKTALGATETVTWEYHKAIELCDGSIEIPQLGTKHSLNISVSVGIVVWDLFQKMARS